MQNQLDYKFECFICNSLKEYSITLQKELVSLLKIHTVITVVCTALIGLILGSKVAFSLFIGGLIVWMNLLILSSSWYLIFQKKSLVLSVSVIVIKYAILGLLVYQIVSSNLFQINWLIAGFTLVLITALVSSFCFRKV